MGAGGMGAISGALILDNNLAYTFAYTGRATFSTGTGASPTSNTISVNGKAYQSETIPENYGAFHLVVVYRDSLELVYQNTFNFDRLYSDDPGVWTLSAALVDASMKENYLVLISSIGNLSHDSWPDQWSKVAQGLEALGATYSVFQSLQSGDDYSFVGSAGSFYNSNSTGNGAVEASSVISGATRPAGANPRASNLRGVLAQDNLGNYRPTLTNLTASYDQSDLALLDAVGLQPPTPWPAMTPGQQAAYLSISEKLCCADIRAAYVNDNIAPSTWLSDLDGLTYPSSGGFTQEDFNTVKAQLTTEINYVADVRQFYANIVILYTQLLASQDGTLTGAYNAVAQALKPHNSTTISPKWLDAISTAETLTDDLASFGGGDFPAQLALDVVFISINHGMKSANNQNGAALQNVETTVDQLKEKSINDFNASQTNVGNLFDLILSDWGRLQALGQPLKSNQIQWDPTLYGVALGSIDRAVRREYFFKLMAAAGYKIGQWTDVGFEGPPDLNVLSRFTAYLTCPAFTNEDCTCRFYTPDSDPENWLTLPTGPTGEITPPPGGDGQFYDIFIVGRSLPCDSANDGELLGPLFAPVDDTDPTKLGVYKPYFFLYGPFSKGFNEKCTRGSACEDN